MTGVPFYPDQAREILATKAALNPRPVNPLVASDWVAMSLLQKGIRRGRQELAIRAAATLIQSAPDRFWRRCAGTAFEDIGVADLETVSLVMAALTGKRFRAKIGGEWAVARFIVLAMCQAQKCRSADDLLMVVERHPQYELARSNLFNLRDAELLMLATGHESLGHRAIAAWYAAGTYWRTTRHLQPRRGVPAALFEALEGPGRSRIMVDLAREGYRKGAGMLAPFVAMLSPTQESVAGTQDDLFPPETMIGPVPGWAFDLYSREGRTGVEQFLNGGSATARWIRNNMPSASRPQFLGGVLFRVEGGLVRNRIQWGVANELRRVMDVECHGRRCPDATAVLDILRSDIPLLNGVRSRVAANPMRDKSQL